MTITYLEGDATNPTLAPDHTAIIAHLCNDAKKWGSGFVLSLSRRWEQPELAYKHWLGLPRKPGVTYEVGPTSYVVVETDEPNRLGSVQFVDVSSPGRELWVANMIGQHGVRRRDNGRGAIGPPPIRYEAVTAALAILANQALQFEPTATVHMPRIGTDRAGGDWAVIEPLIDSTLVAAEVPVFVYSLTVQ